MQRRLRLLVMAVAALSMGAVAQEIVIEPTNGRSQPAATHVTRPSAEATSASKAEKITKPQSVEQKASTKRHAEKQVVAKAKAAPAMTEVAKNEPPTLAPESVPEAKKFPARPAWAMNDTRDAHSLEDEITAAMARDEKLKGSAIKVKVDDDAVTLEGRALSSEERLQAERLAQSYAWNRKLVDHVEVAPRVSAQR